MFTRIAITILLPALLLTGCLSLDTEQDRYQEPRLIEKPVLSEERGAADLVVLGYAPADRYAGPPVKIEVTFNEPVDRESVEQHLYLGDERNTVVPCKHFYYDLLETSAVLLEILPLAPLERGKVYLLNFGAGIKSRLDVPLKEPFRSSFQFSNTPLPREY